ncbi:hypothetical protein [Eubacterium oxidoreducens]|uniref:Uncharacterized protein n=1 Tax=Eubacterium oxidoreducens TaxID=1732 RepID=A0A1G6B3U5_EUBOX|nr:hypothetical protein [Eubacterium oxidoreducens]SDB15265.1 hypothetical protein SAMN02910417_01132 [Eubacterium oxidoreducens]
MSSVSSSVELWLSKEDKELLKKAIAKIEDIKQALWNEDLFLEGQDIYYELEKEYRQHDCKLPTIIDISE